MDVEAHLPLSPRDLLILSVLAVQPLHGYGIIKAVEERSRSGVLLDPANLYRALRRMRRDGWIDEVDEATAPQADPGDGSSERRRTFDVTGLGRSVLRAEVERLERLLGQARPAL